MGLIRDAIFPSGASCTTSSMAADETPDDELHDEDTVLSFFSRLFRNTNISHNCDRIAMVGVPQDGSRAAAFPGFLHPLRWASIVVLIWDLSVGHYIRGANKFLADVERYVRIMWSLDHRMLVRTLLTTFKPSRMSEAPELAPDDFFLWLQFSLSQSAIGNVSMSKALDSFQMRRTVKQCVFPLL